MWDYSSKQRPINPPHPQPAAAIEVHPGVFIGNVKAVKSLELLLSLGVTHVVNTAEGSGEANVNLDLQLLEENGGYRGGWNLPLNQVAL